MRLDLSTRRRLWLQHALFLLLFSLAIGLLAWLSTRYVIQADWSAGNRNTLSESSQKILARLEGPVHVTAYARDVPALRDGVRRLVGRYQRYKPDLTLIFVNPDLLPEQARKLGITQDGELYVEYGQRSEKIVQLGEQPLTQALQRLSRREQRLVLFVDGHGERKPLGIADYDLGTFGQELAKIGIQAQSFNLAKDPHIPAVVAALVIAGPQLPLAPGEIKTLLEYVQQGGNLLWLLEPNDPAGLQALAALLGITVWPGVVVDADTSRLGIQNPTFIPIVDYGPHPITAPLRAPVLLPGAAAMALQPPAGWRAMVLLQSQPRSWTETGSLEGSIQFDPDSAEHPGPLTVGVALSRPRPATGSEGRPTVGDEQRLVVIGDGDFLSNTYLGNGANLELGLNIFNWLTLDDALLAIHPRAAPDANLNLSDLTLALIAAFFLLILPGVFLVSGWLIWFRRRRR